MKPWEYYKQHIFWKETKIRCDITPLFENPKVFNNLVNDLITLSKKHDFDKIAAIDALGFVLGSAVAYKLKKPLILIRKKGKLPYPKKRILSDLFVDYTKIKKGLEIRKNSINKGEKVLIIDEWIETGAQIKSAIKLIEKLGGKVSGIVVLSAHLNNKTKVLFEKYGCKAIRLIKEYKKLKKIEPKTNLDKLMINNLNFFEEVLKKAIRIKIPGKMIATHADISPTNVLFTGNKINALLDFDNIMISPRIHDVAVLVERTCFDWGSFTLNRKKFNILIRVYEKINPLTKKEKEVIIPIIIMNCCIGFWGFYYGMKRRPDLKEKILKKVIKQTKNLAKELK